MIVFMKKVVAGLGEVLWDMLPEGKKLGGAPSNFAYHTSRFGMESYVVSSVGRDAPGREILERLRSLGLDRYVSEVDYPTGTVQVELDNAGIPCYRIREGVAWDYIPYTDRLRELAARTDAVCFGSLAQRSPVSMATVNSFLDDMPDGEGRLKIFDINLRQNFYDRQTLENSLKKCNVLKINDEELEVVSRFFGYAGKGQEKGCISLLNDYGLGILILTCGVHGSYVFTPDDISFLRTPEVKVADTVGAGDSFTASFTAALLKGKDVREAHRIAVEVSAYVCTCEGAMPELPQSLLF